MTTESIQSILHDLWNKTERRQSNKGVARVYINTAEGDTAHGVVGGDSKRQIQRAVENALRPGDTIIKLEEYSEANINHPQRGR